MMPAEYPPFPAGFFDEVDRRNPAVTRESTVTAIQSLIPQRLAALSMLLGVAATDDPCTAVDVANGHLRHEFVDSELKRGITEESLRSIFVDVALLIAACLSSKAPQLRWAVCDDEELHDYGRAVLEGFRGGSQFEPVSIGTVLRYISAEPSDARTFLSVLQAWRNLIPG